MMAESETSELSIEMSHLNETGKRRVSEGFECFISPSRDGTFNAICIDYGLSARGTTPEEARAELERVLESFFRTFHGADEYVEILNRPNNRAAVAEWERWRSLRRVLRAILSPLFFWWRAEAALASSLKTLEQYYEPIPKDHCSSEFATA